MQASMNTMLKLLTILVAVLTFMITTVHPAKGATASEYGAFFECNRIYDVSPHEEFSCDRVALFIQGQCEDGTETVICDTVNQYILDHGNWATANIAESYNWSNC
jgi:hypothetical protein